MLPCYPRQLLDFDVATEMPSYGRLTEVHGQLSLLFSKQLMVPAAQVIGTVENMAPEAK